MLVKVIKIKKTKGGDGRYRNATVLFAIDPSQIETVENVSLDYADVGRNASKVKMQTGDEHVLKLSVDEVVELQNRPHH